MRSTASRCSVVTFLGISYGALAVQLGKLFTEPAVDPTGAVVDDPCVLQLLKPLPENAVETKRHRDPVGQLRALPAADGSVGLSRPGLPGSETVVGNLFRRDAHLYIRLLHPNE